MGGVFHPTKNSSIYIAQGVSYNPSAELGMLVERTQQRGERHAGPGEEHDD